MTLRARTLWSMTLPAAALGAWLTVQIAYRYSPAMAILLPAVLVTVAAIARKPILGVYLSTLIIPLDALTKIEFGGFGLSPTEAIVLGTGAVGAIRVVVVGANRVSLHPAHLAFGVLTLIMVTGVFFAQDTYAVQKIAFFWAGFLALSLVVAGASREELERVLICIAFTGGVVGVIALVGTGDQQVADGGSVISNRATASFAHANVLAAFLILALSPALVMISRAEPRWLRPVMAAAAGLMIAGLVLSLARGGIIGALVSTVVLLVTWPAFRRSAAVLIVVFGTIAAINFDSLQQSRELSVVGSRLSTLTDPGANAANPRIEIWRKTPELIARRPFLGWGEGNYAIVSPRVGLLDIQALHYDHAHNVFLTIAAELGLLGLTAFLAFLWFVYGAARRALAARDPRVRVLALGCSASLAGLLVTSLFEYPPRTTSIMATIMVMAGVLIALERLADEDTGSPGSTVTPRPDPRRAPGGDAGRRWR